MVAVRLMRDWGTLGVYLMPFFRERTFPGADGRLRPPLPIDTDAPRYESSAGDRDVSARNSLASFEADDFLTLRLSRYF